MSDQIIIETPKRSNAIIPIKGTSPLIVHKWSVKAKQQMLDKEQGHKKQKEKRDPQADYEASFYRTIKGDYGFPTLAFKSAMVRAGKMLNLAMTDVRQLIFLKGVPADDGAGALTIINGEPHMREDVCRIARGGTDLRYRGEFTDWDATLNITFYPNMLSLSSVMNLVTFAGETVGVGEWRPEKNGENGCFTIDDTREVQLS